VQGDQDGSLLHHPKQRVQPIPIEHLIEITKYDRLWIVFDKLDVRKILGKLWRCSEVNTREISRPKEPACCNAWREDMLRPKVETIATWPPPRRTDALWCRSAISDARASP
jgi:hypothetical protein